MPPLAVITSWVLRKGLVKERGARNQRIVSNQIYEKAEGIAWVIARAIKARGLPAHHILARVEERLTPIVYEKIDRALEGVL